MPKPSGLVYGVPLPAKHWAQDRYPPPEGFGSMGRVDHYNRDAVGREFFAAQIKFTNMNWGDQQIGSWAADQDGDFWINDIAIFSDIKGAANLSPSTPWAKLQIRDMRSDYHWFSPAIRVSILQNNNIGNTIARRCSIMEPYIISRDSGISATIAIDVNDGAAIAVDYYLLFTGWKEYKNVSR